jgi:hypothetical protein
MDLLGPISQAFLFSLFAGLTAILWMITGPTYNGLLVPEMSSSSLYPSVYGGSSFLGHAVAFSGYLTVHLVDPAVVLVALALGLLYLARAVLGRDSARLDNLVPWMVVYVVLANLAVPVGAAILGLAGATYPVIAGFDGGAWQNWSNLDAFGSVKFSWDNGALAFVVSLMLVSLLILLATAIAVRDALIAVLLVALPMLTLVGAIPAFRPIARRAWFLFGEAAFLPCVVVIPLELAVGAPNILLLVAYLTVALGAPALIASSGSSLVALGLPSAGSVLSGGVQRGLSVASLGATSTARPLAASAGGSPGGQALSGTLSAASKVPLPLSAPIAGAELLGQGAAHLLRHVQSGNNPGAPPGRPGESLYRRFPTSHRAGM